MVWAKNPYQSFCFLNNVSKDAEFHGLSESVFSFLGQRDLRRLEANY
jgi:hypothetical protein